jgi:hypothetical protein
MSPFLGKITGNDSTARQADDVRRHTRHGEIRATTNWVNDAESSARLLSFRVTNKGGKRETLKRCDGQWPGALGFDLSSDRMIEESARNFVGVCGAEASRKFAQALLNLAWGAWGESISLSLPVPHEGSFKS